MESTRKQGDDGGETLVRIPIAFTDDLYRWLRERAYLDNTRMAVLVRQAVREYRDRLDPQLNLPIIDTGQR